VDDVPGSGLVDGCAANEGKPARARRAAAVVVARAILEERWIAFSEEPTRCVPLL